jgi:hypothetical protein
MERSGIRGRPRRNTGHQCVAAETWIPLRSIQATGNRSVEYFHSLAAARPGLGPAGHRVLAGQELRLLVQTPNLLVLIAPEAGGPPLLVPMGPMGQVRMLRVIPVPAGCRP